MPQRHLSPPIQQQQPSPLVDDDLAPPTWTPDIEGLVGLVRIGTGSFATVYRAIDEEFGRPVAVKVLAPLDDDGQRWFKRERALMGRLGTHPHVITPYRSGTLADGQAYLVMELAAGGSLADLVTRNGPSPWNRVVELILPICDALGNAHDRGVLHHDIKPANILLDNQGTPKLTDFGSSLTRGQRTTSASYTLAYAAPETFAEGADRRDERSDLYSLAGTIYTLVSGCVPFAATSHDADAAHLQRILHDPIPPTNLGAAIDGFLTVGLAKNPSHRFQSARAFGDALRATLRDHPGSPQLPATPVVSVAHPRAPIPPSPARVSPSRPRLASSTHLWLVILPLATLVALARYTLALGLLLPGIGQESPRPAPDRVASGSIEDPYPVDQPIVVFYDTTTGEQRWHVEVVDPLDTSAVGGGGVAQLGIEVTLARGTSSPTNAADLSFVAVQGPGAIELLPATCPEPERELDTSAPLEPGSSLTGVLCWHLPRTARGDVLLAISATPANGAAYLETS